MVVCTFDPDFARQAARIDVAPQSVASMIGQMLRVNRLDH